MVKGKIIKVLSTIFECIGIGGFLVYFYNYFTLKGRYDVIPAEVKANLNTYLLIGISGALLFVILMILKYFTRQKNNTEYEQIKMHLEEETPKNINETYNSNIGNQSYVQPNYMYEEKRTYETPKLVHENAYTVPLEKQLTCSNCGSIVDKNATICLHCGFLLQSIETVKDRFDEQKFIIQSFKKLEDKFVELFDKIDKKLESLSISSNANVNMITSANTNMNTNINTIPRQEQYTEPRNQYVQPKEQYVDQRDQYAQPYENPAYYYEEPKAQPKDPLVVIKYFINKFLPVIGIAIILIVGGSILFNSLNKPKNTNTLDTKTSFYEMANNIVSEVENKYKTIGMTLSKNTMYYTLSELNYRSNNYNSDKSYIAINTTDINNVKFYISLVGINNYKDYSINITEKNDLDATDVVMNTATVSDLDGKLLIDSGNTVTIYYKE
jgi:hypothetical protein